MDKEKLDKAIIIRKDKEDKKKYKQKKQKTNNRIKKEFDEL